jgi:hypothetical protein
MDHCKLVTYQAAQIPRAGFVVNEEVFDAAGLTGQSSYATVLGVLNDWERAQSILDTAIMKAKTGGCPFHRQVSCFAQPLPLCDFLPRPIISTTWRWRSKIEPDNPRSRTNLGISSRHPARLSGPSPPYRCPFIPSGWLGSRIGGGHRCPRRTFPGQAANMLAGYGRERSLDRD